MPPAGSRRRCCPEAGVAAASYGITPAEEAARAARVAELRELLARNQLVRGPREDAPAARPESGDVGEDAARRGAARASQRQRRRKPASIVSLERDRTGRRGAGARRFGRSRRRGARGRSGSPGRRNAGGACATVARATARASPRKSGRNASRKRLSPNRSLADAAAVDAEATPSTAKAEVTVRTFASEVDPFELGVLDTGHLVLFRNVWRDGQRYVQGALVDRPAFVATALDTPYRASSVAELPALTVAFQGRTLGCARSGDAASIDRRPAT